jgi:hypothetical protein
MRTYAMLVSAAISSCSVADCADSAPDDPAMWDQRCHPLKLLPSASQFAENVEAPSHGRHGPIVTMRLAVESQQRDGGKCPPGIVICDAVHPTRLCQIGAKILSVRAAWGSFQRKADSPCFCQLSGIQKSWNIVVCGRNAPEIADFCEVTLWQRLLQPSALD